MTVNELISILSKVDGERMVYVPDFDGKAELAYAVVDLCHHNTPEGVRITDDVAIIPQSVMELTEEAE